MTERTLSRRRLLVAGGSVLLAGCGGQASDDNRFAQQGSETGTGTRASQPETAGAETETEVPTSTETSTPTETETRTETDSGTETTETPTEQEPPTGEEALLAAESTLADSVSAYCEPVGGTDVRNVTAAAVQFSAPVVRAEIERAEDHLDRAAESPDVESNRVTELRAYAAFVRRLTAAQNAVCGIYDEVQAAMASLARERFSEANAPITFLDRNVNEARGVVEALESETAPGDVSAIELVTTDEYAAKIEQFHAELDGFTRLDTQLQSVTDGLRDFRRGVDDYVFGQWSGASQEFYGTNRAFQGVSNALNGRETTGGVTSVADELRTIADTMVEASDQLIESCEAGMNRNGSRRRAELNTAKGTLSSPVFVDGLPSVQELRERTRDPDDDEDEDDDGPGRPLGALGN